MNEKEFKTYWSFDIYLYGKTGKIRTEEHYNPPKKWLEGESYNHRYDSYYISEELHKQILQLIDLKKLEHRRGEYYDN